VPDLSIRAKAREITETQASGVPDASIASSAVKLAEMTLEHAWRFPSLRARTDILIFQTHRHASCGRHPVNTNKPASVLVKVFIDYHHTAELPLPPSGAGRRWGCEFVALKVVIVVVRACVAMICQSGNPKFTACSNYT
jgi:hypothetical protein